FIVDLVTMPISVFDQTGISNESNKQIKAEVRKIIRKYFWLVIKRWLGNARLILKSLKVHSTFSK
ncbi:MAG: hypothetical protein M1409_10455, partial [Actinobacteria bacterium]|nr:hypothetical protein [Actinomycetota bacterium]